MRLLNKIFLIALSVLSCMLLSCQDKTDIDPLVKIDQAKISLKENENKLDDLEKNHYPALITGYQYCDSMLMFSNTPRKKDQLLTLDLVQAYLEQFENELPNIRKEISFSQKQLSDLQIDIKNNAINDSLSNIYTTDELKAAEKIKYQTEYFQDRFETQAKAIKSLKKELKKNIKD